MYLRKMSWNESYFFPHCELIVKMQLVLNRDATILQSILHWALVYNKHLHFHTRGSYKPLFPPFFSPSMQQEELCTGQGLSAAFWASRSKKRRLKASFIITCVGSVAKATLRLANATAWNTNEALGTRRTLLSLCSRSPYSWGKQSEGKSIKGLP